MSWIDEMIGYQPRAGMSAGSSGMAETPEEEMLSFESPYDTEALQYKLAQARGMQGERPPLPMGGNRQERATAGLMSAGRGIADWFTTRGGERQEKSAMADLFAQKEMMKNYKKGLSEKVTKIFNRLYDTDPTNDAEAIKQLYQISFNSKISFGDDFGIGVSVDKFVKEKREESQATQEAGFRERELAVKERPEVTKPDEAINTIERKVATSGVESLTAGEKAIWDKYEKAEVTEKMSEVDKIKYAKLWDNLQILMKEKERPTVLGIGVGKGGRTRQQIDADIKATKEALSKLEAGTSNFTKEEMEAELRKRGLME